mgnify:FL=1
MVTYFQIPVRSSMSVFESLELKQKKQNTLRMSSAFQYCCLLKHIEYILLSAFFGEICLDKSKVRPDHMLFSSAYEEEEEEVYLQISVRQYRLM